MFQQKVAGLPRRQCRGLGSNPATRADDDRTEISRIEQLNSHGSRFVGYLRASYPVPCVIAPKGSLRLAIVRSLITQSPYSNLCGRGRMFRLIFLFTSSLTSKLSASQPAKKHSQPYDSVRPPSIQPENDGSYITINYPHRVPAVK